MKLFLIVCLICVSIPAIVLFIPYMVFVIGMLIMLASAAIFAISFPFIFIVFLIWSLFSNKELKAYNKEYFWGRNKMLLEYACKNCGYTLMLTEEELEDGSLSCPCCYTKFKAIAVDPLVSPKKIEEDK